MPAATDRLEFAPRPQPGLARAIGLAVLVHGLLLVALTWGVSWHRNTPVTVEAELWSSVPRQAAPQAAEPPPPPPAPAPRPEPAPPRPDPKVAERARQADIALERERERREKLKEEQQKLEQQKRAKAEREARLREEQEARRKQQQQQQREAERLQARKSQDEARNLERLRQENMRRIAGLAGASGAPSATGSALQSAGPSADYAGRIRARIKPRITFLGDTSSNAVVEVEVRAAPDGTITSRKVLKASGLAGWDDAVLRAIDATAVIPRDVDGRVPSPLILELRPRD